MNFYKLINFLILFILTSFLVISSCTSDQLMEIPEPDLTGCDTTDISFATMITPILEQNCFQGCHNGDNPIGGFLLDSYNSVKLKVDDGRLFGSVAQLIGFVAMPLNKGPIPACDISQIKTWIEDGALDN
jgi:hypothetical protein